MTRKPNQRTQKTREQIRAAAYRLFLRHGYAATSTDAILAEVILRGLSPQDGR